MMLPNPANSLIRPRRPTYLQRFVKEMFATGANGAAYDPSDLTSLYQTRTGGATVTTPAQSAGIMLDKSRMGNKTAAQFIASQPELRGSGVVSTIGTPSPAGAYDPSTGIGLSRRTDTSNVTGVSFTVTPGNWYLIDIEVTGPATLVARNGTLTGAGLQGFGPGARLQYLVRPTLTPMVLVSQNDSNTSAFTLHSFKEIPGFHSIAPSDAARPTYGREPITGRRNLLLQTENIQSGSWVKVAVTAATAVISPPLAGMAVEKVVGTNGASTTRQFYQTVTVSSGLTYTSTAYYRAAEYDKAVINELSTGRFGARFDLTAKTAVSLGGAGFVSASITELAGGWFRCLVVWTSNSTSVAVGGGGYPTGATLSASGVSYAGDGVSGIHTTGAQTEQNATATAYQKVTTAYDVTEAGVPLRHYLQTDGTDDWMQVFPTCNLGETWSHIGGWRSDILGRYSWAAANSSNSALRYANASGNGWYWITSAIVSGRLTTIAPTSPNVVTVERISNASMTGRMDGGNSAGAIVPFDDAAAGRGLALFSALNTSFSNGQAGRFFGGVWVARSMTAAQRALGERAYLETMGLAA